MVSDGDALDEADAARRGRTPSRGPDGPHRGPGVEPPIMLNRSDSPDARRQLLSSLMDGELTADDAAEACQLWRQDAQARSDWHAYHLIGDVLRSDDLASAPAHDAAFLQALRQRLADEPVPLAPQPALAPVHTPLPQATAWWFQVYRLKY